MGNSGAIRILIADDHPIVRMGLTTLIEMQPGMCLVGTAGTGREAVELFRKHRPDIVLMDLRMRELSGVEAIAQICSESPRARIIVLTSYQADEEIYRALQAGARGYLLKDTLHEKLIAAIHDVHTGKTIIAPEVVARLARRIPLLDLTPRELEILKLIVRGMSNKEIGSSLKITEGTVKNHVVNILDKLGVSDRTQAATTALERGIVRADD